MTPHSPGTDQIDTLFWIGFVAATILIVAIVGGLLYALRNYRAGRSAEPSQATGGRHTQLRVGGMLTVFAAAILVVSIIYTEKAREASATGPTGLQVSNAEPLRITATGQQWLWRYDYPDDENKPGDTFSYYRLVVPVDTAVELNLVSTDVVHAWSVPELAGKRDAVPGKENHVTFTAEEEGTYGGQAATLSGQAYASMRTAIDVVSPEAYEAFVEQQGSDIQAAQDRVVGLIEGEDVP
ncbi:MAG: cytochrome c oxidase subunit II [Solirubrobacterales bacterium]